MTERQNGFVLVDNPSQYTYLGRKRISHLIGKPIGCIDPSEVVTFATACMALYRGRPLDISKSAYAELERKFTPERPMSPRVCQELNQAFFQAADLISGLEMTASSYGAYAPSYVTALERQKERWRAQEYRSLLIGCLTKDTAMEYIATTTQVFPQSEPYIVDLEGSETREAPGFILANGLSLPFGDNFISSIQTNYLLHMLERGDAAHRKLPVEQLLEECYRVLSPNGELIMCEGNLPILMGYDCSLAEGLKFLKKLIRRQKFLDITISRTLEFENRQEMVRHFRSSHGAIDEKVFESPRTFLITATKK